MINALVESGDLAGHPGHYRLKTAVEHLVVPTNVRAVLAARIDRLPDTAKRLLQTAAVIGREFRGPVLDAVTELPAGERAAALERLKASDFIYEHALYPVFEYAFKHPLTHEVAYQSQLQSRRAVVHAAVARALESQAGDKLEEQAALLAHHCEAAGEILNATRWHKRAAEWAGLNDINAALHHWLRVRDLARQGSDNVELTTVLALACRRALVFGLRTGAATMAWAEIFEEGCQAAERTGNQAMLATLHAAYGGVRGQNQAVALDFVRYTKEAVRIADGIGDAALSVGMRAVLAYGHLYTGQLREAERVADEAIRLVATDPHRSPELVGISPLMGARVSRLFAVGCMRDPVTALREFPLVRQDAIEAGYPEQALWALMWETELKYALGDTGGIRARSAGRLWEPRLPTAFDFK